METKITANDKRAAHVFLEKKFNKSRIPKSECQSDPLTVSGRGVCGRKEPRTKGAGAYAWEDGRMVSGLGERPWFSVSLG